MRKLLILAVLISFFPTAYATRPRMNSLGQDPNQGSFYVMDYRDFFRNPANVAKMKNFMVAELSTSEGADNLEGGYFGEFNPDFTYGVYLGKQIMREMEKVRTLMAIESDVDVIVNEFPGPDSTNPIDLFFGGGNDLKWGVNINYANSSIDMNSGENKYSSIGVGAGVETSGGLQVYLNYPIQVKSELAQATPTATQGYDENKSTGFQAGLIYSINNEFTLWGQYQINKTETSGPQMDTYKVDGQSLIVGVGHIYDLSPTARFNFDISFLWSGGEDKDEHGWEIRETTLPLVIGFEGDATEWLTLRAFVRQNFILAEYELEKKKSPEGKSTDPSKVTGTDVGIGGTFNFGKLKIDGNLGGFGGSSNSSLFNSESFFVSAAATYMF